MISTERVLTSALLDESPTGDTVTLMLQGVKFATLQLPAGLGAQFLTDCGLRRAP